MNGNHSQTDSFDIESADLDLDEGFDNPVALQEETDLEETTPEESAINAAPDMLPPQKSGIYEKSSEATHLSQMDQEVLFRQLMQDHQKRLYRFVIKYIDHPDDAADITQQAFVEAARTIASFRGDSKLSTWIYGIAMNMVRNYMRKMIEQDLYELPVVSYQELTPEINVQPLSRVELH